MAGYKGDGGRFTKTHGLSRHEGYKTWRGMVQRCTNPNMKFYSDYGGRGISVCEEWLKGPEEFIKWYEAQEKEDGWQLDRLDNDEGYCPENCRLTPKTVNAGNKRNSALVELNGETIHLAEASRRLGIAYGTLSARRHKGLVGAALLAPARRKAPPKGAAR